MLHTGNVDIGSNGGESDADRLILIVEQARLSPLHMFAILVCTCGFAVDLLEVSLGGALSALFAAPPYSWTPAELSLLVSSAYFGAIIGAPLAGWLADRIGPRRVLTILNLWIGMASLLCAFIPSSSHLAVARMIAGVGLGGYPPVMIAYLNDLAPAEKRGQVIFTTCAIAYLGPPLAVFGLRWLTPIAPWGVEGWRWPFAVAGIVAVLAGFATTWAPEAPHWLAATGRIDQLRGVTRHFLKGNQGLLTGESGGGRHGPRVRGRYRPPVKARSPISRVLVLTLITASIPIATISFPLLTGPILIGRHFSLSDTLFYVGLSTFGPIIGTIAGGLFVDRLDRRTMMILCALAMLACVLLFFASGSPLSTATAVVGFSLFLCLYTPSMTMYGAGIFEPTIRARATSTAWALNRVAAAGAPAILVMLVRPDAMWIICTVFVASILANITVIAFLAPPEPSPDSRLETYDDGGTSPGLTTGARAI